MAAHVLLTGLGNPGDRYAANRHNIGFRAIDAIVRAHGFAPFRSRFQGEIATGRIDEREVFAFKPMTFMNDSGRPVAAVARFFKIPVADIIVFHDEIDLAAGKMRVKRGGGAAGHNGLRSIDAHLGPDYWRVRLGIGHPGGKERVIGHVLADFAATDAGWLEPLLDAVARHVGLLLAGDEGQYMSKVALALKPPKAKADGTGSPPAASADDSRGL
jgi:PTH1 family peptidyl-tRNA hydrolase